VEWIILGDPNFYFSQRSGKKFFAGKPRAHALFLFHRRTQGFCIGKTIIQFSVNVVNEFTQSCLIQPIPREPVTKSRSIYWSCTTGRLEPKPGIHFFSAIAAKAQQNAAIMAILGFPLIIPQLILLMRLSNATFSETVAIPVTSVLLLVALDLMVILLAVILFPFLWKD
jgi:heme exporter protein B